MNVFNSNEKLNFFCLLDKWMLICNQTTLYMENTDQMMSNSTHGSSCIFRYYALKVTVPFNT